MIFFRYYFDKIVGFYLPVEKIIFENILSTNFNYLVITSGLRIIKFFFIFLHYDDMFIYFAVDESIYRDTVT